MSATVWNSYRKWMGNLIPAIFWLIPTVAGIKLILSEHNLTGHGLYFLIGGTFVGWIALNEFGLFQNARMRRRLLAILGKQNALPTERYFVGFSSPKYAGALDAHEDVGFLFFTDRELVFVSETRTSSIEKGNVGRVGFRPNIHSMVLLGRWISIEGVRNGQPIRMLIEPREKRTMLGNLIYGKQLLGYLQKEFKLDGSKTRSIQTSEIKHNLSKKE